MSISESMLAEFDQEMANTRKTLERVPEEKFGWKPHEKSFPMGDLATHVANIPSWGSMTLKVDELDIAPPGEEPMKFPPAKSQKELLEIFDKHVTETRAAIVAATDEQWNGKWTLLAGGHPLFTLPKHAVMRTWVMNHNIHHRAQLGVYLRLNDIPVPSIYGPTADESGM